MIAWAHAANARVYAVVLAAVLLVPWPDFSSYPGILSPAATGQQRASARFADAQGVSLTGEQLAGSSPFNEFDPLAFGELSDRYTGGRKRRGSNANFADVLSLQQLQLATYHVNSAPQAYGSFNPNQTLAGRNYLPKVRDQGYCATCVGHAVGAALEAAAAVAMQQDAVQWDVSPQSLYYCTPGGRTCQTGWDISEALKLVTEQPQVARPTSCGLSGLSEPDIGSWDGTCADAAAKCPYSDASLPWLKCSYKSLSSYWQIQQHIRNYGAVVTRMIVYDDFRTHFNPSGQPGASDFYPPYSPGPNAKGLYGHAAIIVGYNNFNKTWTILNSWGKCSGAECSSPVGITSDGMFKLVMGAAGVGSPEDTYGVICEPQAGTDLDPHYTQPWARKKRKPVTLLDPADRTNLTAACYGYTAVPGDTAASIADAFLLDLRLFARDNVDVFTLTTVQDVSNATTGAELRNIVDTVKTVRLPGAIEPFFECVPRDGSSSVVTRCDTITGFGTCTGNNTCTLSYSEQNVTISPAGKMLRVCNISSAPGQFDKVAMFASAADSQPRALRSLLNILNLPNIGPVPQQYCKPSEWDKLNGPPGKAPTFTNRWVRACDAAGYVTEIDLSITRAESDGIAQTIDSTMVNALLTLEKLQTIRIVVNKGDLPAQLGALQELAFLKIDYWCMISKLPTNWGRDWRNLWYLDIRQYVSAEGSSQDVGCGITGKLPVVWGSQMPSLQVLDLSGNRLAGPLPPEYEGMNNLQKVYLQNNQLSYQIPSTWSKLPLTALDLSGNRLEGAVPLSFASISVQERLEVLRLDDNRNLAGCVPLASFTTLTYSNTRITGLCASTRLEIEEAQEAAIKTMLKPLFNADGQNWTAVINPFLQRATMLPELNDWTIQGQTTTVIPHNDARGSLTMTLTIIEGTTYITAIKSTGAGLDLTVLPGFIAALPRLEAFSCIGCNYNAANKTASSLPPELATRVHSYFKTLTLASSKLVGQLPAAWGRLQHLQELQLHENALTGGLPDALADMAALLHLNINDNSIKGQLPAAWGLGSVPSGFRLDANGNEGLTGNIPDSWARFTGYLKLMRTNITGCVPDQLVYSVYKDEPNDPCSGISPEVEALLSLQQVIDPEGSALSSWDPMTTGIIPAPGLIAPRHCRSWVGVKCNSINQVVELDLSDMASEGLNPRSPLKLSNLVQHLAKLPALQVLKLHSNAGLLKGSSIPAELNQLKQLRHLDLSKSALSGPLPELLASLLSLEHLDLSSNADVNGALPELWAGMSGLKFLDLSGCGISGKLPLAWGALQQLQVFRAANTRISGALLPEWGILGSLRELVMTNAQLTGPVPGQWGDAAAMQAAAVKVLAAVQQAVAKAESTAGTNTGTVSVTSDAAASKAVLQQAVTSLSGALSGGAEGRAATAASSSGSGLGLTQLQVLRLRGNKLSGILPDTFSELVQLRDVDLSFNSITGQLPMKWATLSQLKKLDLSRNKITGSLPPYWARLTLLEVLDLSNNVLTGRLQPTWASLANVRHLDLSNNRLSGDISNVWFSLKSAARLDLANNLFTGEFPATWGIMADRSTHKLQSLFLSDLPCMNQGTLQRTVFKSGIAQGGYVKVVLTCCSVSAQKKAKLCKL